ncbi:MAG: M20/M25/M40 family metallo-hydrolase [Promethearchaeota archaeon]
MANKEKKTAREKLQLLEKFSNDSPAAKEAISLLQVMLRCDTSNPPGNEIVLAKILKEIIDEKAFNNVKATIIESEPTRGSLIVEVSGTDPGSSASWGFMSHLDVVPVEGEWEHPPFSGELVRAGHDDFIWGRGAFDIKYLGAANLVALFTLLEEGFRPKGNIKIFLCADEEQGGHKGVEWLMDNHPELMRVDCCLNEGGGFKLPLGNDFIIQVGEKGVFWTKLKISGKGGHGSIPPHYDKFAIYKMMRVLARIKKFKKEIIMTQEYFNTINNLSIPGVAKFLLRRKRLLRGLCRLLGRFSSIDLSQIVMPMVTDTIAPTNFHSGIKENSISPEAYIILDIRTLPNHDRETVNNMLEKAIGRKLWAEIEWEALEHQVCTTTATDNEYYGMMAETMEEIYPGCNLVPLVSQGSTDCKFFRQKSMSSYGFCPMIEDEDMDYAQQMELAHNKNERVSVTNLMLAVDFSYRMMKKV